MTPSPSIDYFGGHMALITIFHIIICIALVVFVLLQDSKGALGGSFGGGGSSSLLGPTGAPNFLAKLTRYVAIIFAILCIVLSKMTTQKPVSALDEAGLSAIPTIPATKTVPNPNVPVPPTDKAQPTK